jgi:hypothetical protein
MKPDIIRLLGPLLFYANYAFADAVDGSDLDSQSLDAKYNVDATDHLVFSCLLLFFAVCLSAVSTLCAYCVYAEDQILRNFVSNGIKVDAKVVEYTLTNRNRQEYTATIDYRYNYDSKTMKQHIAKERDEESIAENIMNTKDDYFATIIRKRIKCAESDFVLRQPNDTTLQKSVSHASASISEKTRSFPPSKQHMTTNTRQQCKPLSLWIEIQKDLNGDSCDDIEKFPSFDVAVFTLPQQYYVDVIVLPDYPTSAIGYKQLMQSLNHAPIIVLIASLSVLAYFCVYISVVNIDPGEGLSYDLNISFAVLAIFMSTEILISALCCRHMILDALKNAYELHTVDSENDYYLNFKTEDETLHTMPSSFGGIGAGFSQASMASTSWKHSSPNLCSIQMKQQNPRPQMEDLILD